MGGWHMSRRRSPRRLRAARELRGARVSAQCSRRSSATIESTAAERARASARSSRSAAANASGPRGQRRQRDVELVHERDEWRRSTAPRRTRPRRAARSTRSRRRVATSRRPATSPRSVVSARARRPHHRAQPPGREAHVDAKEQGRRVHRAPQVLDGHVAAAPARGAARGASSRSASWSQPTALSPRWASAAIAAIAGAGASAAIEAGVCVLRALRMSEAVPRGPHHAQSERRRPAPPTLGRNTCCDFWGGQGI